MILKAEHPVQSQLCLTITFLDPRFHGRRDGGEPEWPPSPLRLYQAIVAATAAPTGRIDGGLADALRWFERLPPPRIVTPASCAGAPYRLSVPNNAMDLVVKAWVKGNYDGSGDANPATHRTMKTVRPTHLVGGDHVRYIWELPDPLLEVDRRHAEVIRTAVRSVVALGWGVDLVVGHGEINAVDANDEAAGPPAEKWEPGAQRTGTPLRAPVPGTFDALLRRHRAFLNRVTDDGFVPVPPLTTSSVTRYRRASDPRPRPYAAFTLASPFDNGKKVSFPQHRAVCVAAMLRHAACEAAKGDLDEDGWRTEEWGRRFVAGHGQGESDKRRAKDDDSPRFSYLPLPTIDPRGVVGDIRRVMIAEPFGGDDGRSTAWVRQRLGGTSLNKEPQREPWAELLRAVIPAAAIDADDPLRQCAALYLSSLHPCQLPSVRDLKRWLHRQGPDHPQHRDVWPHVERMRDAIAAAPAGSSQVPPRDAAAVLEPLESDGVLRQYITASHTWASVTPVILPRYVSLMNGSEMDVALRECLQHAGVPCGESEVKIESRLVSWFPRAARNNQFKRPAYLRNLPAVHVFLRFLREPLTGPISLGAGRHCGLGILAVGA